MNISVTSPVRLEFSRPMDAESVIEHLTLEPAVQGTFHWEKNTLTFIPDLPWAGGQEVRLRLEVGARAMSWLAFPLQGQEWSFNTSKAYLAYLWPADGPADIYGLNPQTGEIRRFTSGLGVLEYTASRDGISIYFSASNAQGGSDLYMIDRIALDRTPENSYHPRKLFDCGASQCRSPAASSDGQYLAYEYLLSNPHGGSIPAQIWTLNLTTQAKHPVGETTHETIQPAWSSTGWLAYYDRTSGAYDVLNPQAQVGIQLPNQTGQPGALSPDGRFYLAPEIYYHQAARTSETGASHLLRYNLQTAASDDISGDNEVEDVEGVYSPDGGWIAFTRKFLEASAWSFGRQLWVMQADGSNPHPITFEPDYNHYDLAWSRDGMALAYVRFNQAKLSDPPELWMVNADGSDPLQLVIGGYSPLWIP